MNALTRREFVAGAAVAGAAIAGGCSTPSENASSGSGAAEGLGSDARSIIAARKLSATDVTAALRTFVPSARFDDYYMFASGGHSGQVVVIGIPSMRILKIIPVFTPDAYGGWGYSTESKGVLAAGGVGDRTILHGDTHHPALSETGGDYDGEFLFINDKVNSRVAVIDLKDFETKQIVKNPLMMSNHGNAVTPDTDYLIETSQYATPLGWGYVALNKANYKKYYRGAATYWKFDRSTGRIDVSKSFAVELPPYCQDLTDAGKLASDGWSFTNSFNSELAIPDDWEGGAAMEIGASQNPTDWLHVINWRKAESLVAAGRGSSMNGFTYIPLEVASAEGVLFLIPEPKSPHGVDVTPDGNFIVVGGKLDPNVQIYSFAKIQDAIKRGGLSKDQFGVPVIPLQSALTTQLKLGLGPLHTVFDGKGYAYTSLFLDSAVTKWQVGKDDGTGWQLVDKLPAQYNTGHLAAPHGDTVKPHGEYVVALNKWSLDRFAPVGPFYPRNLQLVATDAPKLQWLYDMPIGMAEPHYAQIVAASVLKPWKVYPQDGWEPTTGRVSPLAPKLNQESVKSDGDSATIAMTLMRSHYHPDKVEVRRGQKVTWRLVNVETTPNAIHGFALPAYNVSLSLEPGKMETIEFVADKPGVYPFYCTDFCSALHLEMVGYFLVS